MLIVLIYKIIRITLQKSEKQTLQKASIQSSAREAGARYVVL